MSFPTSHPAPPTEGVYVDPIPVDPYLLEQFYVDSIGHNFVKLPPSLSSPSAKFVVQNYLLDQTQSTQGGAQMVDPIQFDLTENAGYSYELRARGKKFHIRLPEEVSELNFTAYLGRQWVDQTVGDVFVPSTPSITFENLSGNVPEITYDFFGISKNSNSGVLFAIQGKITGDCSFSSLRFSAPYQSRQFDPGPKWYRPLSYAQPIGLPFTSETPTFVMFSYSTKNPTDTGRFITVE